MLNNILISREDRSVKSQDEVFIGMEGENLQEVLIFNLDEQIEGNAIIEILFPDESTAYIEIEKTERGYELPVKSSLLTQNGIVKMQLRIIQVGQEIFKSDLIRFKVKESINAAATIPEEYPTWIDNLEALKLELQKAEEGRVEAEQSRVDTEKAREETFNQMGQAVDNAIGNIADLQEAYDKNAQDKIKEFNDNATNQLKAHNTNATNKITEFNENAETQTNTFNQNATDKTDEFDKNAQDKLDEYNKNSEVLENRIVELESQVADLETENENIKNQIPTGEAGGENITLNDSAEMEFKEFVVGGNSWQETREGYNELKTTKVYNNMTYYGVTCTTNDDGTITLNGTASQNTEFHLQLEDETIDLQANENYILKRKLISGTASSILVAYMLDSAHGTFNTESKNLGVSENVRKIKMIRVYINANETFNNARIGIMLCKGTTEKPFELYGAMPSPEFPSEIRNVGDNVNEFDVSTWVTKGNNSNYYSYENGELSINALDDRTLDKFTEEEKIYLPNGNYCLSNISSATIRIYNENTNTTVNTNEFEVTLGYIYLKLISSNVITCKPKIEKGTKATPYSPYNCGNFNETVCNKNLIDILKWATGTYTYAKLPKNTKYVLSMKLKEGKTIPSDLFVGFTAKGDYDQNGKTIWCVVNGQYPTTNFVNKNGFQYRDNVVDDNSYMQYISVFPTKYILRDYFDIQLEETISNEPSEYQPHQSQHFTFPLAEGQRMYKDSYLADDGVHHKRGQIILDGSEPYWSYESNLKRFVLTILNSKNDTSSRLEVISNNFKYQSNGNEDGICFLYGQKIYLYNYSITSLDDFKTWLSTHNTTIEYELAEEVIEPYTEEQQKVYNGINKAHSYKNVTHIFSTDETSPVFEVTYRKDLETMFNNINNAILGGN